VKWSCEGLRVFKYGRNETRNERWLTRYKEVEAFIETNHRNPSKYNPEEKLMVHFIKWGEETDECRGDARTEIVIFLTAFDFIRTV